VDEQQRSVCRLPGLRCSRHQRGICAERRRWRSRLGAGKQRHRGGHERHVVR
jgi:hypothetical protein